MLLVALVSVLAIGLVAAVSEFPRVLQKCKAGDTTCLATTMTEFLHSYPGGYPELGLAPIDPLFFGNTTTTQGGEGPVSATLSLYDASVSGWSKAKISKVVGFEKDPRNSKFEFHVSVPVDTITGRYGLQGQILYIPVFGTGNGKVEFFDVTMNIRLRTTVVTRDGEDYLKIQKVHLDLDCKKLFSQLDNLFNDAVISKNINKILNDNALYLFKEVQKLMGSERGKIVKAWLAPLFHKYPYRMLFAEDDQ